MKITELLIEVVKVLKLLIITEKTGNLISLKNVTDEDDLMVINKSGITIRMAVATLEKWEERLKELELLNLEEKIRLLQLQKFLLQQKEESTDDIDTTIVSENNTDITENNTDVSEDNTPETKE